MMSRENWVDAEGADGLRWRIKMLGLTLSEFADLVGCAADTVRGWGRCSRVPVWAVGYLDLIMRLRRAEAESAQIAKAMMVDQLEYLVGSLRGDVPGDEETVQ